MKKIVSIEGYSYIINIDYSLFVKKWHIAKEYMTLDTFLEECENLGYISFNG